MKKIRLETKIKRILLGTLVPMVVLMLLLLAIVSRYISQYDRLLENLAISSEFNLHFKDDVDLGMYSIAVGTEENSYLPEVMKSVRDAEKILNKLKENTSSSESRKNLKHLESYLKNLEKRMVELTEITEYDLKMVSMDNNIRILTRLIVEEMQNFIYNESMYLVHMESIMTRRVYILVGGVVVLFVITAGIMLRRSFRFSRSITRPVTEILGNVREVGRGNFEISEVDTDSMEIEELDAGIRRMAEKIEQLLQTEAELVFCYCDLDHLKYINDNYGHSEGDCYLRHFVDSVKKATRENDLFARLGGDDSVLS